MSCGSDFEKGFVAVEAIAESPRQQEVESVVRHGVPAMWHQAAYRPAKDAGGESIEGHNVGEQVDEQRIHAYDA